VFSYQAFGCFKFDSQHLTLFDQHIERTSFHGVWQIVIKDVADRKALACLYVGIFFQKTFTDCDP